MSQNSMNNNSNQGQQNPYYNNNNMQASNSMQNSNNQASSNQNAREQNPYYNTQNAQGINQNFSNQSSFLPKNLNTSEILTGALIGAAATYVLTNENVQKALFKGALSIGDIFNGGLDEMKERFEDAKAEREAQKEA